MQTNLNQNFDCIFILQNDEKFLRKFQLLLVLFRELSYEIFERQIIC